MSGHNTEMPLEAVYYSAPVPRGKANLTALALVFDRVHFPNVYLPDDGFDPKEVAKEAERIERLGLKDFESSLAVGALRLLPHLQHLRGFCEFAGVKGQMCGGDLDGATTLRERLELALFGATPPGTIRSTVIGFHKGLPGGAYMDFPDPLNYPANAVLYASAKGLPIVNDSNLPVLPVGESKLNPTFLAGLIALRCVELALPVMPPLTPAQISELRHELSPHLGAFRGGVARLTTTLQVMLGSDATETDMQRAAEGLVRTDVAASLTELEATLRRNKAFSIENSLAAGGIAMTLLSGSEALPSAVAGTMLALGALGAKIWKDIEEPKRLPMYYLLKARKITGR